MTLEEKIQQPGPKKLLALDGGGIRGLITIEVLARIEEVLQERLGRDDSFTLSDYFDYVGGTSTGAIIATCISLGMRMDEVRHFYEKNGEAMFNKAGFRRRFLYKYAHEALAAEMRAVLGEDTTLGSEDLRTLLLIVMRNARTDSPWPITNNPEALFNDRALEDCNLDLPLWQLVRASTAAPTFFPPEVVQVGPREFVFVDGGTVPARVGHRTREHADHLRWDGEGSSGRCQPASRGHEPALQCEFDSGCTDVRRVGRAGLALPLVRALPRWSVSRHGDRFACAHRALGPAGPLHLRAL